ncbi:hypothetical protein FRC01_001420 [Tulasnella sp. 417]|nr:hypothetical protein FRC01_001420 [Tulasnella sp. 417]
MDLNVYANKELVHDMIKRVPRILEIFQDAIRSPDPPGQLAPSRLPLILIVGLLTDLDVLKTFDPTFSLLKRNLETMSWLVFAPFFSDRMLYDRGDTAHLVCGGNILLSYYDVGINLTTPIIDEAISRFGVPRIAQHSIRLCKMSSPSDVATMLGTRILVLDLLEDPRFHEPLISKGRVHRVLLDRFWACTRASSLEYDELSERTCDIVDTLNKILEYLTDARFQELIIRDLVMNQDLLPIMARVALWADEKPNMGLSGALWTR